MISVMKSNERDNYRLGYICMGKPKIAFNCLAELRGCEYVMQKKFDAIRNAILTGEDIDQVVFMQGQKDNHMDLSVTGRTGESFNLQSILLKRCIPADDVFQWKV